MGQLQRLGALGEMSSMIAHELNQPLAGIRNYASGIVRRLRNGHAEPTPLLQASEEIEQLAARAAATVQRVRSLSQRRVHARAPVGLQTLLEHSLAAFRAALPPDQMLTVQCDAVPDLILDVDSLQIEQVLLNLLRNGLDAMRDVPPEQRELRIACKATTEGLCVAVIDRGAGLGALPPERLFEPFFTTKQDGVGLGLAICKRVIEAHGGNIEARSNAPGPGLTVAFTLPRESAEAAASREEAAHA
jgi:two-component system sensor histidine kinase TtrS